MFGRRSRFRWAVMFSLPMLMLVSEQAEAGWLKKLFQKNRLEAEQFLPHCQPGYGYYPPSWRAWDGGWSNDPPKDVPVYAPRLKRRSRTKDEAAPDVPPESHQTDPSKPDVVTPPAAPTPEPPPSLEPGDAKPAPPVPPTPNPEAKDAEPAPAAPDEETGAKETSLFEPFGQRDLGEDLPLLQTSGKEGLLQPIHAQQRVGGELPVLEASVAAGSFRLIPAQRSRKAGTKLRQLQPIKRRTPSLQPIRGWKSTASSSDLPLLE